MEFSRRLLRRRNEAVASLRVSARIEGESLGTKAPRVEVVPNERRPENGVVHGRRVPQSLSVGGKAVDGVGDGVRRRDASLTEGE